MVVKPPFEKGAIARASEANGYEFQQRVKMARWFSR